MRKKELIHVSIHVEIYVFLLKNHVLLNITIYLFSDRHKNTKWQVIVIIIWVDVAF